MWELWKRRMQRCRCWNCLLQASNQWTKRWCKSSKTKYMNWTSSVDGKSAIPETSIGSEVTFQMWSWHLISTFFRMKINALWWLVRRGPWNCAVTSARKASEAICLRNVHSLWRSMFVWNANEEQRSLKNLAVRRSFYKAYRCCTKYMNFYLFILQWQPDSTGSTTNPTSSKFYQHTRLTTHPCEESNC